MSEREAFVEKLKAKLDDWNSEAERLESKAGTIDARTRAHYRAAIQEIKGKAQQIEKKMTVIKNSSTDAWQDLKAGAENAWKDFEKSLKQSKARFQR